MKKLRKIAFCVIIVLIFCGICLAREKREASGRSASDFEVITIYVKKGDTLINLCDRLLKDPDRWPEVAKMNNLSDPDMVYPKNEIKFPVAVLRPELFIGKVKFLKGDVDAMLPEGRELWQSLYLGDRVWRGSKIKTGKDSMLVVEDEADASFVISSNTTMEISELGGKDEDKGLNIFLKVGRFLSSVKSKTEVKTPTAVAGIRGTDFRVSVDAGDTTRTEVLSGIVAVSGMEQEVTVNKGEGTVVEKDTPPITPVKLLGPPVLKRVSPHAFQFDNADGASSYRVILARDERIHEQVKEKIVKPEEVFDITGMEYGTYYAQGTAIDRHGLEGIPSEPEKIVISDPMPPLVQLPVDGIEYQNIAEFRWVKSQGATKYHLQVAEDSAFKSLTEDTVIIWPYLDNEPQEEQICSAYREGYEQKTYYFRIAAVNKNGHEGLWSDVRTFSFIPRFKPAEE